MKVEYLLPSGMTARLFSEPLTGKSIVMTNETIGLLIDKENQKNYYLGFNIETKY